jgi:methionyl-tRNA synthetase
MAEMVACGFTCYRKRYQSFSYSLLASYAFVNAKGGEKFSKSLSNAPDPKEVLKKYSLESVRYYMLSQVPIDSDHDFDFERFEEVYNADLANDPT